MSLGGTSGQEKPKKACLALKYPICSRHQTCSASPLRRYDQSAFGGAQGEELGPLEVVEVGQAVQREPFGLGEDGQPLVAVGAHRSVGHAVVSIGWIGLGLSL
jgi:hypothetical protein